MFKYSGAALTDAVGWESTLAIFLFCLDDDQLLDRRLCGKPPPPPAFNPPHPTTLFPRPLGILCQKLVSLSLSLSPLYGRKDLALKLQSLLPVSSPQNANELTHSAGRWLLAWCVCTDEKTARMRWNGRRDVNHLMQNVQMTRSSHSLSKAARGWKTMD